MFNTKVWKIDTNPLNKTILNWNNQNPPNIIVYRYTLNWHHEIIKNLLRALSSIIYHHPEQQRQTLPNWSRIWNFALSTHALFSDYKNWMNRESVAPFSVCHRILHMCNATQLNFQTKFDLLHNCFNIGFDLLKDNCISNLPNIIHTWCNSSSVEFSNDSIASTS